MRKIIWLILLLLAIGNAHAVQLVCKGGQQRMLNQRPIYIDCSNRKAVIDALGAGWRILREQGIGGDVEHLCRDAYKSAKEATMPLQGGLSESYFFQCNMALKFVK